MLNSDDVASCQQESEHRDGGGSIVTLVPPKYDSQGSMRLNVW